MRITSPAPLAAIAPRRIRAAPLRPPLISFGVFAGLRAEPLLCMEPQANEHRSDAADSPPSAAASVAAAAAAVDAPADPASASASVVPVCSPAPAASVGFPFEPSLTLESIRASHRSFSAARDWGQYHTPRNLLLALVGEVGELSEIFQWRHEVQEGLADFTPADKHHVGEELSDVLLYLCALADRCHIDLAKAVQDKMANNEAKYPPHRVHGSSKKYDQYAEHAAEGGEAEETAHN